MLAGNSAVSGGAVSISGTANMNLSGGVISDRGPKDEIFPKILADTVYGCNRLEVDGKC